MLDAQWAFSSAIVHSKYIGQVMGRCKTVTVSNLLAHECAVHSLIYGLRGVVVLWMPYVFWNIFSTTSANMFEEHAATSRHIFITSGSLLYQHGLILIPARIRDYIHYKLLDQITIHSQTSKVRFSWWRHPMETFSALLALCEGNPPVTGGFPQKGQWRGALKCF